jgi:hypothetical protein
MKKLIVLTLALFAIQSPAIAQINRTAGDRVSDLGKIAANNNREAVKACQKKGGNIIVKSGNFYTCFYAERLAK